MKKFGISAAMVGVAWAIYAIFMNVCLNSSQSFARSMGASCITNIDLMSQRQNHLIIAGTVVVVGVLLLGFGTIAEFKVLAAHPGTGGTGAAGFGYDTRKCPACAEMVKREAKLCRFCRTDLIPEPPQAIAAEPGAPKEVGECQNCQTLVAVDCPACPKCKTIFGPNGAWQILRLSIEEQELRKEQAAMAVLAGKMRNRYRNI